MGGRGHTWKSVAHEGNCGAGEKLLQQGVAGQCEGPESCAG